MKKIITLLVFVMTLSGALAGDRNFYFTTTDSVRLYVRVAGEGKPCLFVHGGPGSTSYYFEAFEGASMIERKMQMIYYDQRGSGRSDSAKNRDYSLARMIRDMEEIRVHLGIKKWSVMGHSFAGILMTNYALAHPKNVSSMMYIHCTMDMQASMSSHVESGIKLLDIKDATVYLDSKKPLLERVGMIHNLLSEKDAWYKLMYRNAYEKKINDSVTIAAGKFNRDFASNCWNVQDYWKSYTASTANIKCPVMVMTGDKDYAIGVDHYKSFRFPNQRTIHYIGGHAPFQEEPQWFAEKIIEFIK